jgi:hypothetical protein
VLLSARPAVILTHSNPHSQKLSIDENENHQLDDDDDNTHAEIESCYVKSSAALATFSFLSLLIHAQSSHSLAAGRVI